jgi:septal ring factor EnvC (AmiA/AmiB activator)
VYPDSRDPERLNDNAGVAKLDQEIDALYQGLPADFTASRNALAKTLAGEPARQVKSLKKPTVVPWAVNQVYWKARPVYSQLMERGRDLRTAQIASLKGRKADVRGAMEAHRRAVGDAVRRAEQIGSEAGLSPDAEQLARMFEALSLAPAPPSDAGRFTEVVAPMGFEALSGVTPVARPAPTVDHAAERKKAEQERRQRQEADARINAATRELERAQERVSSARKALKQAESDLAAAQAEVEALRSGHYGLG